MTGVAGTGEPKGPEDALKDFPDDSDALVCLCHRHPRRPRTGEAVGHHRLGPGAVGQRAEDRFEDHLGARRRSLLGGTRVLAVAVGVQPPQRCDVGRDDHQGP